MGIRFQCHHCGHPLHVKDFQAGKKGRCPECKGPFRIPLTDAAYSLDPQTNLSSTDSAITSSSTASSSNVATATADATLQRASTQRTTTGHRANTIQSPSLAIEVADAEPRIDSTAFDSPQSGGEANSTSQAAQDSPQSQQGGDDSMQPKVISEAPDATWYVRPAAGGQYGPAPTEIMWQWLAEGRVGVDSLVWRDDWPEWHPANQVFAEFFDKMLGESASSPGLGSGIYAPSTQAVHDAPQSSYPSYVESPAINSGHESSILAATAPIATTDSQEIAAAGTIVVVNREARKRRSRVKYTAAITILMLLLIALGVGLVIVLTKQGVTQ